MNDLTPSFERETGQVILEGLPAGVAGEASLIPAPGLDLAFDRADGRLCRVVVDTAGTLLVTFILVVASVAAMLGFELTRGQPRRRRVLTAVVTAGYLALLGLRTEFLITVSSESLLVALLQSALLTAISAGLVLCGSAVMARTRHLSHSRARTAARRAARAAADARAAQQAAAEKLQRHIGSLYHMLLPWALRSAVPEGVDHARWDAALDHAIRALFPTAT